MQGELFKPVTRTERQHMAEEAWLKARGKGTVVCPTGFGKTRIGTDLIQRIVKKKPTARVLVVVPTEGLQEQWTRILDSLGLGLNAEVVIINTGIRHMYECDFLIIDEFHRSAAETLIHIFDTVKYRLILGLTATLERLDDRHELLKKFCPVVDEVTPLEAAVNGWVAPYKEYLVLIDVDDIETLKNLNKEFQSHFAFFNFDFNLAMSMCGKVGYKNQLKYRDLLCPNGSQAEKSEVLKSIKLHSAQFMRVIQDRKKFVNNHPKKIELAKHIIENRPDSKIITFSNSVAVAESIGMGGKVYSGKDSKKKSRATIEDFHSGNFKILHTVAKANEGLDVPGLSVAIIIGHDSSKIKATQRRGRVIRKEDDKQAEIFNIVINNSMETEWFNKSHSGVDYITIDEEGLEAVLRGEDPKPYTRRIKNFTFRF